VFSGMIGVTFFGLFLTPVFYVLLQARRKQQAALAPSTATAS
jgi:HAE1 family hydrophobic/amphiphilic exporter-1